MTGYARYAVPERTPSSTSESSDRPDRSPVALPEPDRSGVLLGVDGEEESVLYMSVVGRPL